MVNNSLEKKEFFIKHKKFLALAMLVSLIFSYVWKNQFFSTSETLSSEEYTSSKEEIIKRTFPFFFPRTPNVTQEGFLISQLPDINQIFVEQPSQVPGWLVNAVKQQVQPSPKRFIDIENHDELVVRDRVVVIPKVLHVQSTKNELIKKKENKLGKKQFTIQLIASVRRDDILHFVNTHRLNREAKMRLTKRNDADWFVLTLGEYEQLEKAQAAIKNLPPNLAKFNPWIRPLDQLRRLS